MMNMQTSTCFFIGHREAPEALLLLLMDEVERHITEYGVTSFVVGHYGHFDALAARAVKTAKQRHPEVTLTLLLPYQPFDRPIPTPEGYDGTFYPPDMELCPKRYAIVRANQYAIEHSDYLIAYVTGVGKSRAFLNYAERKGVPICNLGAND